MTNFQWTKNRCTHVIYQKKTRFSKRWIGEKTVTTKMAYFEHESENHEHLTCSTWFFSNGKGRLVLNMQTLKTDPTLRAARVVSRFNRWSSFRFAHHSVTHASSPLSRVVVSFIYYGHSQRTAGSSESALGLSNKAKTQHASKQLSFLCRLHWAKYVLLLQ